MNNHLQIRTPMPLRALSVMALAALLLVANAPALAAPGAHGPNGEHLDGPTTMRAASALPRVEAKSETFELVAELRASELAIVVDRYESNEPVLGAKLEVESGTLKAVAAFRAEQGDYAVTDAALLKALAAPGEHGLVFTLVAGSDSDLLDGTLMSSAGRVATAAAKDDHGHAHGNDDHGHGHDHELERAAWIGAGVAALGLIGGIAWWRQRRRDAGKMQGGL
ncbi:MULTISPECIES: hypothetical protein [unclassified Methylibium]|uniref:hypothetical protein n=1 Tax=unclassified Methylibium TaxID=2633235 RepID=UPI0003F444CF|nr:MULTISPECIES: hypothetical protein [unclassified Methylibium]EWS56596.1 hypothetical protein X551_00590 [Methylibium sp. T29]EWS61547.1 hypothetical protein Y694_00717 [Methylibium sp. T29-B]MBQ1762442.1 hypothetical protein [Aquincola sp.]